MASVLVADPDPADREHVESALTRAGFRVTTAGAGEAVLADARRDPPALVILEVQLGGRMSGYETCRELREMLGQAVRIVFLSSSHTEPWNEPADLGADACLAKPVSAEELVAQVSELAPRAPGQELTRADRELLQMLASGHDQRWIARQLFATPKAVGRRIDHVLRKLNVRTRAEAIAVANERGILGPDARAR